MASVIITARYAGTCAQTGKSYPPGTRIEKMPTGRWKIAAGMDAAIARAGMSAASHTKPQPSPSNRQTCAECGRPGALVADMEDGLMKHYGCCDMPPSRY